MRTCQARDGRQGAKVDVRLTSLHQKAEGLPIYPGVSMFPVCARLVTSKWLGSGGVGSVYWFHDSAYHRLMVEYDSVMHHSGSNRDNYQFGLPDIEIAAADGKDRLRLGTPGRTRCRSVYASR